MFSAQSSAAPAAQTPFDNPPLEWIAATSKALTRMGKYLTDNGSPEDSQALKDKAAGFPALLPVSVQQAELYRHSGHFAGFYGSLYQVLGSGWVCKQNRCAIFLAEPSQVHFQDHGKILPGNIATEIVAQAVAALFLIGFEQERLQPTLRQFQAKPQRPILEQHLYQYDSTTGYSLLPEGPKRFFVAAALVSVTTPKKPGAPWSLLGAGTIIGPGEDGFRNYHDAIIHGAGLPMLEVH